LIGPDGVARGRHRKVHLYGDLDKKLFIPSETTPTAFPFEHSQVGLLICYDVEFPEAVRHLAVAGARTVLVPTANMAGYEEVQQFLVRARACENGCGVVYANYCGADDVFEYNGLSVICGPSGEVLAQASAHDEDLLVADIPGESTGAPYLADRRAELYRHALQVAVHHLPRHAGQRDVHGPQGCRVARQRVGVEERQVPGLAGGDPASPG
jgi:predicted amidohydrolase